MPAFPWKFASFHFPKQYKHIQYISPTCLVYIPLLIKNIRVSGFGHQMEQESSLKGSPVSPKAIIILHAPYSMLHTCMGSTIPRLCI